MAHRLTLLDIMVSTRTTTSRRTSCVLCVSTMLLVCSCAISVYAQSGMVLKPTLSLGVGTGHQGEKSNLMVTTDISAGTILFMQNPAVVLRLSGGFALSAVGDEGLGPPSLIIKCQAAYVGEDMDNVPFFGFILRKHLFSGRQDIGGETEFVTEEWDEGIALLLGFQYFVRPTLLCEWTLEYALMPDIEYRNRRETRSRHLLFLFGWNWIF